jgi:hypothetical protein
MPGQHGADRVDPESVTEVDRRPLWRRKTPMPSSNADAVFKISSALHDSAFSLRNAANSATGTSPLSVTAGRVVKWRSSIQLRNVA